MTIKAIAWDIDGTLIDSEPLHYRALLAGSAELGIDLSDVPEEQFCGVHMEAVWQELRDRLPSDLTFEAWLGRIHDYYVAHACEMKPIEGVLEAFAHADALGLAQACVSNSERRIVDTNISALGIADRLRFSISRSDVQKGKPDPEPYLAAAARLGLAPSEIVVIEDSATGAMSGHLAGMKVVGFGFAPGACDHVDHYIRQFTDLPALLKSRM